MSDWFRWVVGTLVGVLLLVAGWSWAELAGQVRENRTTILSRESRIAIIEATFVEIDRRLERIERKLDQINSGWSRR